MIANPRTGRGAAYEPVPCGLAARVLGYQRTGLGVAHGRETARRCVLFEQCRLNSVCGLQSVKILYLSSRLRH